MTQKAIYKPTSQKTIVLNEYDGYCEILLDNEYKTVSNNDLNFEQDYESLSSFSEFKEVIFLNCIKNPLSDVLYSYNSNRLVPQPHQYKPLIKFLNSENNRILIADEVGLGKTIEAGLIFTEIDKRENLKISLIVVPSSLTLKWKDEMIIRFDEDFVIMKTNEFINFMEDYDNFYNSKVYKSKIIISYHTLRDERVVKKLKNSILEIDFLIMDEAHTMRNEDTSTFYSAEILTNRSDHIVFLTATPVQNNLSDLFNVLSLLDNDYFKDYGYFERMITPNAIIHKIITMLRNNNSLQEIKDFVYKSSSTQFSHQLLDIFNEIMGLKILNTESKIKYIDKLVAVDHLSFIINRTKKKDVGISIPRNAKSITVSVSDEEKDYYNAVIDFIKFLNPGTPPGFITIMPERMASSSMIASLESFKEIKQSGKLFIKDIDDLEDYYDDIDIKKEAVKFLDSVIEKGNCIGEYDSKFLNFEEILKNIRTQKIEQLIVFSFFKKTLDYLEKKLNNICYRVCKIHGDITVEDRFQKIKDFKNKKFDILLSSEVGSEGLDMQFCNVVINYDLPWNPMRVEQRIGRIDRIGQKFDKLHIFNLCIEGSIEDRIYSRLYEKLHIFERSIGELEPILGDLEFNKLNIGELMHLSQNEIDAKIELQKLAIMREELELSKQTQEVEKLINEDVNYKSQEDKLINSSKIKILQNQCEFIFLNFLDSNKINYTALKDGTLKLSTENTKQVFNTLKNLMSDKRTDGMQYKIEFSVLQKINKLRELKVSFETNNNEEYQTIHLYLNHPIILMITRSKKQKFIHAAVSHKLYKDGFAVVYRVDLKQLKSKSYIKTIILSNDLEMIEECDYFEFIENCSDSTTTNMIKNFDANKIKTISMQFVIKNIESFKNIELLSQNRLIDAKVNSINNYFNSKISKIKKLHENVIQADVKRMRIGEIDNLVAQKDNKISELNSQRDIQSSFEILGIVGL